SGRCSVTIQPSHSIKRKRTHARLRSRIAAFVSRDRGRVTITRWRVSRKHHQFIRVPVKCVAIMNNLSECGVLVVRPRTSAKGKHTGPRQASMSRGVEAPRILYLTPGV